EPSPVRYHVYQADTGTLLRSYVSGTFVAHQNCSREPTDPLAKPATPIVVRAVDLAGNEEQNQRALAVPAQPECNRAGCSFAGVAPGASARGLAGWIAAAMLAAIRFRRRAAART